MTVDTKGSKGRAATQNVVLTTTMVSTAFQIFVLAVLAKRLLDEFDINRFELGLIGSLNTAVGAVTAPFTGRVTDRFGPRQTTIIAQLIVAAGFAVMALANSVLLLIVSSAILGIPQGWGNPTTNALIAERVEPGRRGVTTGIKQSGVQLGIFLAGISLPVLSDALGWRGAIWIYVGVFAGFALLPLALPAKPPQFSAAAMSAADTQDAIPYNTRAVWLLALYAFLMGTVGGGISRFLALFAEEEVGLTNSTAGVIFALSGLVGMAARVMAGRLAEQRFAPLPMMAALAVVGGVVAGALTLTLTVGAWILWPIAVFFAIGHGAWNAVAMLAIIVGVAKADAGRASGTVMFGFLGGLAVGAPIAGLVIDETNSYQPVWIAGALLSFVAAALARYAHSSAT